MAKVIYTTNATVTGGRDEGKATTESGNLDLDIRIPKDVGGPGGGTNPEELFAVGYAACFNSALKTVGRRLKMDADDAQVDSEVSLVTNEDRGFDLAVKLDVKLPSLDDDKALELIEAAHKVCPFSNATRNNIEVELTANGQPAGD